MSTVFSASLFGDGLKDLERGAGRGSMGPDSSVTRAARA